MVKQKTGKVKVKINYDKMEERDIEEFDWKTSTWKKVPKKELEKLSDTNVTLH